MAFKLDSGMVAGETIAQWTQKWWTWALQAPANQNPLLDTTGSFAHVNNTDSVFFIGGTFGDVTTADRTIANVPAGEPLLIPVLNQFDTLDPPNVENKILSDFQKSVTSLFAEIDGVSVKNLQSHLVRTDFFSMGPTQPGSLIEQLQLEQQPPLPPAADLSPTKSSGYWLMVDGLSPGQHTLHFGGSLSSGFSTDVTDHITVG
jgi:hypothetical protein